MSLPITASQMHAQQWGITAGHSIITTPGHNRKNNKEQQYSSISINCKNNKNNTSTVDTSEHNTIIMTVTVVIIINYISIRILYTRSLGTMVTSLRMNTPCQQHGNHNNRIQWTIHTVSTKASSQENVINKHLYNVEMHIAIAQAHHCKWQQGAMQ